MSESHKDSPEPESEEVLLREARFIRWLSAHAQPNGGFKGFLRSNLFSALVIFLLAQIISVAGLLIVGSRSFGQYEAKWEELSKWRGGVDQQIKHMDENGTNESHHQIAVLNKELGGLDARLKAEEAGTAHLDVLESEFRTTQKEVERLKDAHR